MPDTLDGRFELLCLHAFLFLLGLKRLKPRGEVLAQAFFDLMFDDLDRALREMGTGDLSVGKQVKRMAQGFYGRIRAYEDGLDGDEAGLRAALVRNLYGTVDVPAGSADLMAAYLRREAANLRAQPEEALLEGIIAFGPPLQDRVPA